MHTENNRLATKRSDVGLTRGQRGQGAGQTAHALLGVDPQVVVYRQVQVGTVLLSGVQGRHLNNCKHRNTSISKYN